jgi:hypothetical protein
MQGWKKKRENVCVDRGRNYSTHRSRHFLRRKITNYTYSISEYFIKMMLEPNAARQTVHQATIGNIDYERVLNGETVPREFFCPICSCLLWQPRSCGVCQNLFCEACISKWLQVKQNCPYGCERYEDKRCSPQIRCLLSNVWIQCQSAQYGCTAVLSYDTLEEHQTKQCPCPSTRCQYCEHLVRVSEITAHEQECSQRLGNCTKCDRLIPMCLLEKHKLSCIAMNPLTMNPLQNLTQPAYQFQPNIPPQETTVQLANIFNYTPEERSIQEQYRELVCWRRIGRLVCLSLSKPLNAPHLLLTVWRTGFGYTLGFLIRCVLQVFAYCFQNLCTVFLFIILLVGLLHSVVPCLLDSVNDPSIMTAFTILFILVGSVFIHYNAHVLDKQTNLGFTLLEYIITVLLWKITLLLIRFYFHWVPAYVTATFISSISIYMVVIARLAVQPLLPT